MPQVIIAYLVTAIIFFVVDFIWLGYLARGFYLDQLGELMAEPIRVGWAAAFYLMYVAGIVWFAIRPALASGDFKTAALNGAILGFLCYATYDMTNIATLRDWPVRMSLVDMAWGTLLTAAAATGGYSLTRWISG